MWKIPDMLQIRLALHVACPRQLIYQTFYPQSSQNVVNHGQFFGIPGLRTEDSLTHSESDLPLSI